MSAAGNAFLAIFESQTPAPVKAKARAFDRRQAEKLRAPTAAEKSVRAQSKQISAYKRWQRLIWKQALLGPHGLQLAALKRALRRYSPTDAEAFVSHVEAEAAAWIRAADIETRHIAFQLCANRVQRIRQNEGLQPFEDSIPSFGPGDPGEPDCVVTRCKAAILGGIR